jgi:hypothetical protein
LSRVGHEDNAYQQHYSSRANQERNFDELVGKDGMLKSAAESEGIATGIYQEKGKYRRCINRIDSQHFDAPASDDHILFDHSFLSSSHQSTQLPYVDVLDSRERSATLEGDSPNTIAAAPASPTTSGPKREESQLVHSTSEHPSWHSSPSIVPVDPYTPGNMTPTTDGMSTAASVGGSQADDIAVLMLSPHLDAMSEGDFSEINAGHSTPESWTDIGSGDESDGEPHYNY